MYRYVYRKNLPGKLVSKYVINKLFFNRTQNERGDNLILLFINDRRFSIHRFII